MATPDIELFPEPMQEKNVTFLRLAPDKRGGEQKAQISLLLKIKSGEPNEIELESVGITIPALGGSLFETEYPVSIHFNKGTLGFWHTRVFNKDSDDHPLTLTNETTNQNIVVPSTANIIKFTLKFRGFDPFERLYALRPHVSPTDEGSYAFPAKASDLRWHEFWSSSAAVHGESAWGSQLFALDVGVVALDNDRWNELLPGKDGRKNSHYRIWRKPVYAMADGKVVKARWDFPDNENPREEITDEIKALMDHVGDGGGNLVLISTDDELHSYNHFIFDSVPENLRSGNPTVHEGDFLGLAGNSGSSSNPHLHFGVVHHRRVIPRGDAKYVLRPMPFNSAYTINSEFAKTRVLEQETLSSSAPWFKNTADGLNHASPFTCLVWPGNLFPGTPKLILKRFTCVEETDAEAGNESPYFVILVGRRFAGTVQSRVIRVRKEAWDGTVVGNGQPVTANVDIIGNLDETAFVLVALLEEDNDPDLAGSNFSQLRTTVRADFDQFAADENLSLDDLDFLLAPRFALAISNALVNDELLGVKRLTISTLDGNLPLLRFTGDGADYKVRFKMEQ